MNSLRKLQHIINGLGGEDAVMPSREREKKTQTKEEWKRALDGSATEKAMSESEHSKRHSAAGAHIA